MIISDLRDLAALQASLRSVCFDRHVAIEDLTRLGGDHERWLMYRTMVRLRLNRLFEQALPRSFKAVGSDAMQQLLDAYYASGQPWTRFFWVLPMEFVDFVSADSRHGGLAEWQLDLLRYEAARWEVADLPADDSADVVPLDLALPPKLSSALRILELRHPVHKSDCTQYEACTGVLLAVYRGDDVRVHTLELNPTAHALLTRWQNVDESIAQSLRASADERGWTIDEAFLNGFATWLATLSERGILVGSRTAPGLMQPTAEYLA